MSDFEKDLAARIDLHSQEAWHPEEHITFEEPRPIKFRLYVAPDGSEAAIMHGKGVGMVERARPATEADLKAAGYVPAKLLEEARDYIGRLAIVGGRLSNIAFNLSQSDKIDPLTQNTLNEAFRAWDEVRQ